MSTVHKAGISHVQCALPCHVAMLTCINCAGNTRHQPRVTLLERIGWLCSGVRQIVQFAA